MHATHSGVGLVVTATITWSTSVNLVRTNRAETDSESPLYQMEEGTGGEDKCTECYIPFGDAVGGSRKGSRLVQVESTPQFNLQCTIHCVNICFLRVQPFKSYWYKHLVRLGVMGYVFVRKLSI